MTSTGFELSLLVFTNLVSSEEAVKMFTKRQQQIIETAIRLIAEKGIQNLTIKNLANEIKISEPALYRHFSNKLDILMNILKHFRSTMQPAINQLLEGESTVDNIINFTNNQFIIFSKNHNLAKIIFAEANFQNEDELKNKILVMMNTIQKILSDKIIKGQSSGEISNNISATNLTRIIIGSMRFLVTQWSMSGMIFNIETEGKQLCSDLRKIMQVS